MTFKKVKLIELVEPVRGNSLYTKEYGDKNTGKYPVYSASNSTPLTSINHYDYDGDYLTWSTNGFGGFLRMLSGQFSVNGDRGVLVPLAGSNINIEYLRYVLQPILRDLAKGRKGDKGKNEFTKVPLAVVKKVMVEVPVDENGEININAQLELVKKYRVAEDLQNYLKSQILEFNDVTIDVPISSGGIVLRIEEIFDLDVKTNSSFFTKQYVDTHKGDIPVYSASKDFDAVTYGYVEDNLSEVKYFQDILTWNIDGSVGKAFFRKGRFSLSEKVIPLVLQKKWEGYIDYDFVKFSFEEKSVENGFGFSNKAGKSRIKDIQINFPKKIEDGVEVPDIEAQRKIADKYKNIYLLKDNFISYLQELEEVRLTA